MSHCFWDSPSFYDSRECASDLKKTPGGFGAWSRVLKTDALRGEGVYGGRAGILTTESVEKLRPAERKQLASQRWQSPLHLALQVHSVKGVTVMEGQFSRSADGAD